MPYKMEITNELIADLLSKHLVDGEARLVATRKGTTSYIVEPMPGNAGVPGLPELAEGETLNVSATFAQWNGRMTFAGWLVEPTQRVKGRKTQEAEDDAADE